MFMNEARTLDTADRFVNCKCAKYYLRSSAIDTAIETAALFTRVRNMYISVPLRGKGEEREGYCVKGSR